MRRRPVPAGALAAALLAASAAASLCSLGSQSATFDEAVYPAAGLHFLRTGRLDANPDHPPLAKALMALPLYPLPLDPPAPRPEDERGFASGREFLLRNRMPAPRIVFFARLSSVAAGLALGLVVFLWARRRAGPGPALAALAFLLCEPAFRALSGLAVTDIFLALFLTAAFWRLDEDDLLSAGALGAAAALCKFSGLLFLPAAFAALALRRGWRPALAFSSRAAAGTGAALLAAYSAEPALLARGLAWQAADASTGPSLTFFAGLLAPGPRPLYHAAAFLMKTPYPFLIAAAAGLWAARRTRARWALLPAAAVLAFLAAGLLARKQALRHLYPVYPLLALFIACAWKAARTGGPRAALALLLAWHAGEAAAAFPRYLSYFNPPWRGEGGRWLANSDFDWGQDLPALRALWEREGRPAMLLCYFGTAEPSAWGVTAQEVATVGGLAVSPLALPASPPRELLAVSAGCRRLMTLTLPDGRVLPAWAWLDERAPMAKAADTIEVYDVSRDVEAHGRIGQLHFFQGEPEKALRQARRVLALAPGHPDGLRLERAAWARLNKRN